MADNNRKTTFAAKGSDERSVQDQFHLLGRQRDEILKRSTPIREKRDEELAKISQMEADVRKADAQIKEIESPLYELDRHRARLVRALNGRVGDPADASD
jgi:uncharacterized coiled-coil DUF342 family protein